VEHHAQLKIERRNLLSFPNASALYEFAVQHVSTFRQEEFDTCWNDVTAAAGRTPEDLGAHFFMREFLWVVYVSGFKAARVSQKFKALLQAHGIEDAQGQYLGPAEITTDVSAVLRVWGNRAKAKAVRNAYLTLKDKGWHRFCQDHVSERSPTQLRSLPFMGPALSCHLARNLGNVNVVKPDVHLERLASHYGFPSSMALCQHVSIEPPGKTDLYLWFTCVDHGSLGR
jgi:hypothetical protein